MSPPAIAAAARDAGRAGSVDRAVLTTVAELERLVPEWQVLWSRAPRPSPFTSPAWLLGWWRHRGGGPLRVVTLRLGTRLIGVLPMFLYDDGGTRRLLPLGISLSDMFDMPVETGCEDAAIAALHEALSGMAHEWARCEFHEVPGESVLHQLGAATAVQSVSPVLDLESFARSPLRSGARRRLARARRRMVAAGLLEEAAGPDEVEALVSLHTAQWQARGEAGVLADPATARFHRDAAAALARAGALRLRRVHERGRTVAVLHAFSAGRRVFAYLNGVDPAHAAIGLGTVLIGGLVESALAEGARELDFLRGAEPYKFAWGASNRLLLRLDYPHPSIGRLGARDGTAALIRAGDDCPRSPHPFPGSFRRPPTCPAIEPGPGWRHPRSMAGSAR